MANNFESGSANGIGVTFTEVYAVPAAKKSLILGLMLANVTVNAITASVRINDATGPFLVKDVAIPAGATLNVTDAQKIVLQALDAVDVQSSIASSIDAYVSVLEDIA